MKEKNLAAALAIANKIKESLAEMGLPGAVESYTEDRSSVIISKIISNELLIVIISIEKRNQNPEVITRPLLILSLPGRQLSKNQ